MNRWVGCFVEWLFGMLVGGLVGWWVLVIQSVRWLPNWCVGSLVGWLVGKWVDWFLVWWFCYLVGR